MMLESDAQIEAFLKQNRYFDECLLNDLRWRHFGTVIDLVFQCVSHSEDASVPTSVPAPILTVTLRTVHEVQLRNSLTEYMCLHPEEINWGISEVAQVRLINDETVLRRYDTLPLPVHLLRCEWEGSRRLDVVFGTLEVS